MVVKGINKDLCGDCKLRLEEGCPIEDTCPMDVWRLDEEGKPFVAYPEDCQACFLCYMDCPLEAIEISPVIVFHVLPY